MNFVSEKHQLQSQGSVFTVSFSICEKMIVGFIHSGLGICLIVYSKLTVNVSVNGCLSPWNSTSLGFNILHLWGWRCCDLILQIKLTKSAGFSWPSSQGSGPASLTQGCWRETSPHEKIFSSFISKADPVLWHNKQPCTENHPHRANVHLQRSALTGVLIRTGHRVWGKRPAAYCWAATSATDYYRYLTETNSRCRRRRRRFFLCRQMEPSQRQTLRRQ